MILISQRLPMLFDAIFKQGLSRPELGIRAI